MFGEDAFLKTSFNLFVVDFTQLCRQMHSPGQNQKLDIEFIIENLCFSIGKHFVMRRA